MRIGDKFKVKKSFELDMGDKKLQLKVGDVLKWDGDSPSGNVWFYFNGKRGKTENGSIHNILKKDVLVAESLLKLRNVIKEIIISELDGKRDKGTDLWNKYYAQQAAKPKIFDIDNVKEAIKKMNAHIKAPYVGVQYSDLGGPQHVGIYMLISLDKKGDWPNSIIENSRYFRMSLSNEGKLELFSGGFHPQLRPYKFRKATVKSVDDAIKKINDFIALASKGDK